MNGKEVYFSEEVINIAAEIEKIIKKIFPLITNITPYFKIIQLEILLRMEYKSPNWYYGLDVSGIKEKYIKLSDEYMLTPMHKDMNVYMDIENAVFWCRSELTLDDNILILLLEKIGELIKNTKISDELHIFDALINIENKYENVYTPTQEDQEQLKKIIAENISKKDKHL